MIGTGVSHALQTTTAAPPGASVELAPPAPELTSAAGRAWAGTIVWPAVALALVFGLALWLRLIGLGGAVTEDEDQWIARSGTFARGLETRDWQRTFLTGHPGVTVMWVTSLTLGLERAAPFAVVRGGPDVTVIPGFLPALHDARVPFAVLQSLLVIACAALVMRLLNVGVGLVAGLVFAAEPFWAGVGPIVGMDGPLSGFLTISLLCLMLALAETTGRRPRFVWTVLSGLAFGLACLTKTTALLAGPMVPALAALAAWQAWRGVRSQESGVRDEFDVRGSTLDEERPARRSVQRPTSNVQLRTAYRLLFWVMPLMVVVAWGLTALLTIWLVWPAAWLTPVATAIATLTFSAELGSVPHGPGNFFLGQPIEDPGAGFYPVALALRMGPATTVGILLLFTFGTRPAWRRTAWTVLGFVVLFVMLLTTASKKVDRYLLPVLPALGILAAVGWYEAGQWLTRRGVRGELDVRRSGLDEATSGIIRRPTSNVQLRTAYCLLAVAVLAFGVQVWPLLTAGRYPLSAYNPLFGGVRMAEKAIPVGWGDGLDVAGDLLRQLAGGREVVTSIWSPLRVNFGAHAPGPVVSHLLIAEADFYVDYVHSRQRRLTPRQLVSRTPDAVVTIGGVDYARIYRLR